MLTERTFSASATGFLTALDPLDAGLGVHRLAAHLSVNVPAFGCEAACQHPAEPSIRSDDQTVLLMSPA
jgi:hypothetical protein